MIANISRRNPEIERNINELVGPSFSFRKRLHLGGIGSPRFIIQSSSEEIWSLVEKTNNTKYSNMEVRSGGVLIGFKSVLETYVWVIGFRALEIKKTTDKWELHDGVNFIRFHNSEKMGPFIDKLLDLKQIHDGIQ